jgi:phosphotransferase system  glucose/maltose/N-acetylglucosamine-specific IIC component
LCGAAFGKTRLISMPGFFSDVVAVPIVLTVTAVLSLALSVVLGSGMLPEPGTFI